MDLTDKTTIQQLLRQHHVQPNKRLGQHFLASRNTLDAILHAAELSKSDTVLEMGPGFGTLTVELARRAKMVLAVEKDPKMVEILRTVLNEENIKNVTVIEGDILKLISNFEFRIANLFNKMVADIPYYLTSRLLRLLLETPIQNSRFKILDSIVLLLQKEVAERICAQPPRMSLLAVSVQHFAEPNIVARVSKTAFWPIPEIDSAILKLTPQKPTAYGLLASSPGRSGRHTAFFKVVHAGFSQPRKFLAGNLVTKLRIEKNEARNLLGICGIPERARAQNLSLGQWRCLSLALSSSTSSLQAPPLHSGLRL